MQKSDLKPMHPEPKEATVVWDPLVRLFHWSLAIFFCLAYFLEGEWLSMHSHTGYTVFLLVLFRVIWGTIGPRHAKFADFVTSPRASVVYLKQLLNGTAKRHIGHNPAGSAMIVALMITLSITALSGMALFATEGSGPLAATSIASWPEGVLAEIHEYFTDFTLVLVIVHMGGVILTSVRHKENLTRAMITGSKRP